MIPNTDEGLVVLIEVEPGRVERHRIRAWASVDGSPQVLDRFGGLVAASLIGRVRGVDGIDR